MSFTKLLIAWVLSMVIYAFILEACSVARGKARSGFVEAFAGLGVLLAIPGILFALIVGWPMMSWLGSLSPAWLVPVVATAIFALLMWVLTTLLLPGGWRGAGHALVGYAAVLGVVWGCINLASAPAG